MLKKRVGVLISGRGSNLEALLAACRDPAYPAEIVMVISNRPKATGLDRARAAGVPVEVIDHKPYSSREDFDAALDVALRRARVELVANAGFMRLLGPAFVEAWLDRQLNIHPSLLPAFPGLHVHERVIAAGARISGATVHFVRAGTDAGPIVAQVATPVSPRDTPETLASRVLALEHQLYPMALRLVASGAARVEGERMVFADLPDEGRADALFSPPTPTSQAKR
jgi:phosphoribosylglycinamide formyltransferase 1